MPIYTKDMPELLEPGLRTIWGTEDRAWAEEFSKVFDIQSTVKATETDFGLSSFALAVAMGEADPITYDTVYRTYKQTYTAILYGLGFIITRVMYEDDQYRQMNQRPKSLARSMNETVEIYAFDILNNCFATNKSADASYICSTTHPYKGGTWSNRLDPSADLDITSYEQSLIGIGEFVNDRGLKYRAMARKLIVSPANAFMADQILKSAQLPGGANNDINPAQGTMPEGVFVGHFLTDSDAWWIKTDAPNCLNFFWRRQKEFANDSDFQTDNAQYKSTMRFVAGCTDPRGIYGSSGG